MGFKSKVNKVLKHNAFKNVLALSVLKIVQILFPLITIPFLTRTLPIEVFGLAMMIVSAYGICAIFTDYGFGCSATYKVTLFKNNKKFISYYLSSILFIKAVIAFFAIVGIIIYFNCIYINPAIDSGIILLLSLIIIFQAVETSWFFYGIEKMQRITLVSIVVSCINFVLLLSLVTLRPLLSTLIACYCINALISSFLYIYFIYKEKYYLGKVSKKLTISEIKESFFFFLSRISVSLSTTANNLVIGTFSGSIQAALYGSSEKIYNGLVSLSSPISGVLYPYMSRTKKANLLLKICLCLFVIFSGLSFFIYLFSEDIMVIVFGEKYRIGTQYLNIFLILVPINVTSISLGYPAFASVGKPKIANYTVIVSSIIYIIIMLSLYYLKIISALNVLISMAVIDLITLMLRFFLFMIYKKKYGESK